MDMTSALLANHIPKPGTPKGCLFRPAECIEPAMHIALAERSVSSNLSALGTVAGFLETRYRSQYTSAR